VARRERRVTAPPGRHEADPGTRCIISDAGHAIIHLGDPHDETGDRLIRLVLAGHAPGQGELLRFRVIGQ
jgi:hypothetical protein